MSRFLVTRSLPDGEHIELIADSPVAEQTRYGAAERADATQDFAATNDRQNAMFLFSEDEDRRVSSLLSRLANYDDAIQPIDCDTKTAQPQKANLGVLTGVYLPCIQNIFGVIIFIRMTWMTGTAGIPAFFAIVLLCCSVTFCTSISLSAIATNGIVPAGGSYFMISRSLGPEFGGAVGVLFFLGTSVAGAMYIAGAVEILLNYLCPQFALFGDFEADKDILYHNIRIYGTLFLAIIGFMVFIGVRFVSKFAPIALLCVLISIASIYVGIFVNYSGISKYEICVIGERLLSTKGQINCSELSLEPLFCNQTYCDPFFAANRHRVHTELAIPGLSSGVFWDNIFPKFRSKDSLVVKGISHSVSAEEKPFLTQTNSVFVDITTSFTILVAIYFPSCTGILAGSNRSGDLADAQKAIPLGTLGAQLTTSFVYLSVILLFGASFNPLFIRDKFGESLGKELAVTLISWPHPLLILIGALLSTFGAALQSLIGAPRLLQAIAKDNVIPFLDSIDYVNKRGEPVKAIMVSLVIAECAILIGNLDFIAPILTMFFLMCYMFLNLACTVQSLLRSPSWRPRFRYFHWTISLIGIFLCLLVMLLSSWIYTICAMALAAFIYKYIEYRGAEKEWGDGIRGLALSAARFSLLRLEEGPPHTKNWRPQLLCLVKLQDSLDVRNRRLLTLASQLKAGKGLTIVASVLHGQFEQDAGLGNAAKQSLRSTMDRERVKGFAEVVVARDVAAGLSHVIQTAGLGGLKHNTVMCAWPNKWRHSTSRDKHVRFLSLVRAVTAANAALVVAKGLPQWPDNNDRLGGTVDIWWIVHDGGLLILLAYVLSQHRTWRSCRLRVFTVAQLEDNSVQMKKDLEKFLYHLRIEAAVEVIEMSDSDVSAYTYERTILMEQRTQVLQTIAANEMPAIASSNDLKPDELNVRRMHTAVRLNEAILAKSHAAKLVIVNMPGIPRNMSSQSGSETNYMEFVEVLTEGLERVLLARGSGREVITIFS
ncbi:solute carrier family 12 member 5-like isoform X2 [Oppia nitens]|uniref:solute carrier family 12 member 5-like isoform X2 n=1 Tax=Oppia nitens TaxID=1686743 RepID=UPI0023DCA520|nr:solute carrier family 12 member 5-like isoform X2 [Oppia nitens]